MIQQGRIYAALPPLYKVTKGKENFYLLDDEALEEFKKKNGKSNLTISRFKGLGEMNAEQLEDTVMNRENRILKRITVDDATKASRLIRMLMGTEVEGRKKFVSENSQKGSLID